MSVVIQVEKLAKVYRLGELSHRDFLHDWARKLRGDLTEIPEDDPRLFHALREVSFEVREGEVLGLLGGNGAGKSTLLKILGQITAPTRGCVRLRGRVASLLEVGTGFHQDLTGRHNVFMNGHILGMTRREVQAKFDEIVAFSGVEEFIDTPVKRYSVGMRVRLAFAVAAHLEPEILLVDEVLAVGDASFQQKCLGKIGEVSRQGRTVLLVSHSNAAIEALCSRAIVLRQGRLVFDGPAGEALDFAAASRRALALRLGETEERAGTGEVRLVGMEVHAGEGGGSVRSGAPLALALQFVRRAPGAFPHLGVQIVISSHLGVPVFTQANYLPGTSFGPLPERGSLVCRIPRLPLTDGTYQIGVRLLAEMRRRSTVLDEVETAAEIVVENGDFFGSGLLPLPQEGMALVEASWSLEPAA